MCVLENIIKATEVFGKLQSQCLDAFHMMNFQHVTTSQSSLFSCHGVSLDIPI